MLSFLKTHSNKKSNIITSIQTDPFIGDRFNISFAGKSVLKNISFKISDGDFVFLTGESGAGKTTFLKLLSGEVIPSSGRVAGKVYSKDFFVATVFQDLKLLKDFTCIDNLEIAYDPSIYKSYGEFTSDLNQLAKIFNIQEVLEEKVVNVNRGSMQIIAIMRALLSRPQMLLADEPTSALDSNLAGKLFDVLSFYNAKRGLTVVWTSHNRELVKRFNGVKVHLHNGKIQYAGQACFI